MGQVVAAIAGGALLGIAGVLGLRLRAMERRNEQRARIETAVRVLLGGVETFRQEDLDRPPELGSAVGQDPDSAVEVRAKAHLRLMMERPRRKAPGRATPPSTWPVRSASIRRP